MARLPHTEAPTPVYFKPKSRELKAGDGADGDRNDAGPLRFERRREVREDVEPDRDGKRPMMSATYTDGDSRFGILHMEVVDQSRSGLGVRSRTAVKPGMRITICPPGSSVPWLSAVAARCAELPDEDGCYRIGLALSPRFAA